MFIENLSNLLRHTYPFCGVGSFRVAMENIYPSFGIEVGCALLGDIDAECQKVCAANFSKNHIGDMAKVDVREIPNYDALLAGFPLPAIRRYRSCRGLKAQGEHSFSEMAKILLKGGRVAFVLECVKRCAYRDFWAVVKLSRELPVNKKMLF